MIFSHLVVHDYIKERFKDQINHLEKECGVEDAEDVIS